MDRNQILNDPEETQRVILDGRQSAIWTAIPGIVTAVNLTNMTVSVQPAIQGAITDENGTTQSVNLPLLINVPIVFPGAGGFMLTFPITFEDEVLVVFASRCIDSWWQSGGIGRPMEARMHDLSDGFAIPGPRSVRNVPSSISSTDAQLRNVAGDVYISITEDGIIKVAAPNGMQVTGNIDVDGEVTANGIPLSTHLHGGVTPGVGNTGVPIP